MKILKLKKLAKRILTKYSDGHYTQFAGHENIIMAMKECAKDYHKQKMKEVCKWKYDEDFEYYNTSCGEEYALNDGTVECTSLEDNKIKHCPFCGKKISLLKQEEK